MTAIDPLSGNAFASAMTPASTQVSSASNNGFDQDTFLKLLVAQLQNQDPMNPEDSTQMLAQTAQFTMVEKLSNIETDVKEASAANEVLEAGSMIGKSVTIGNQSGLPSTTTVAHVGGNLPSDAPIGSQVETTTTLYTSDGTAVPIKLQYTKLADGSDGSKHWELRTYLSTTQLSGPTPVDFDTHGERTSPDVVLTTDQLENVPGTHGKWDPSGVRLDMGATTDAGRLRVGTGASTLQVLDQNGTDGKTITGIVTGARFTADGPMLSIGGREYSLLDVEEVNVSG
jgi:flagellar basal-body rod modification protein FlgD